MANSEFEQLHLLQRNLSHLQEQKNELHSELLEVQSALKDIDSSKASYRLVGKLMIAQDSKAASCDLEGQIEVLELKMKTIEAQEAKIMEKMNDVQAKVMEAQKTGAKDNNN